MHPYQSQIDRMWNLINLKVRASKNGFWIETVSLTYIILEIELRLLLTSKAGKQGKPLSSSVIDKCNYLKSLADLALEEEFINPNLYDEIISFNKIRSDMTHGLIQGRIEYPQLEDVCKSTSNIINKIQSLWLSITIGPEESR